MASSKKVGVLTFHRCINYGSYWQARALVEGLRGYGFDAVILDHRSARATRAEWKNAFQPLLPRRTSRADFPAYSAKARKFLQAIERLPLSQGFPMEQPERLDQYDAVVVGSDEVWNFRHPWYAACPLFFGEGVKVDRLVSYAASFGCYDAADQLEEPWVGRLRRFAALAVRDENSRRIVRQGLGRDPALVLDPCLQFDTVCRLPAPAATDVAVVYGHGFPEEMIQATRRWAKATDTRLLSLGYRNDWADEQRLFAGPEEFAELVGGARAVVTNYFHGCVFALINARPFACSLTDYRWRKITGLLALVGADDRLVGPQTGQAAFDALLEEPPAAAGERLEALRAQSADYIRHALQ